MNNKTLSWVILAGGRASRMGGNDKGLVLLNGKPLIENVLLKLKPQIDSIYINANRNLVAYESYAPVVTDRMPDFQGPLAGIHAALQNSRSDWVGFTPCDTPNLPEDLVLRLTKRLDPDVDVYVAHDGQHAQPVFSVWNRKSVDQLTKFLSAGDRKIKLLLDRCNTVFVDFSDCPDSFINLNTPEELDHFGNRHHDNA